MRNKRRGEDRRDDRRRRSRSVTKQVTVLQRRKLRPPPLSARGVSRRGKTFFLHCPGTAAPAWTARGFDGSVAIFRTMSDAATLEGYDLLASGKVREIYDAGDRLMMVASDRVSTYDAIHPTPIPGGSC
jgi:hypothetical protein